MAEALLNGVLQPVLETVLENLSSLIQKELGLLLGVDDEIKRLSSTLTTIQAVLEDAEEKQLTNKPIKIWLQKLKDAAHVLDDILDDCATETIRLEYHFGLANKGKRPVLSYFSPKHVLFRHKIAKKMKNISRKLVEIAEERNRYQLREIVITERVAPETMSTITERQIYGREEDKGKIVDYLVNLASNFEDLLVYPIVGMGGLGKTTLAQLIFNDERVTKHFELRIWVCVSDDFNLKRILKAIIKSAGGACEDTDLEPLQKKVQELVERKRYLLVLDDVWNYNLDKWDKLKYVVARGSKGASILTTTRLPKVADVMVTMPPNQFAEVESVMRTMPPYQLSSLSEDDCWTLFKHRAFRPNGGEPEELVAIGKEIVKKCKGVPLAAKALGGLLRFKNEEKEWLYVKESNLWSLPQEEDSILPALRLSYLNLPVKLRQCFAFCAIFPKDHEISKHFLIELWMANGFISSSGSLEVEDVGDEVWKELCWRSFFQDIETDELGKISFKMHDLIHNLAQAVVADEVCCINDSSGFTNLSERIHHLSINTYTSANQCDLLHLPQVKSLKTCIVQHVDHDCLPYLLKRNSLRVLWSTVLNKLPSSIGYLRHLRYLNLSSSHFKMLPESICDLWNLQVLNLNDCHNLQMLPNNLTRLRALRHLHLIRCFSLSSLPSGIGQLTFLMTLNVYIVDKKEGFLLTELEQLKLRGELHIQHLEKVRSVTDAKKANMVKKKNLDHLRLSWCMWSNRESQGNVEQILEALEPSPQLKSLAVIGYGGDHFPQWMGSATFKYLVEVELFGCDNCLQLQSLGKLPSLKKLAIRHMNQLRYVDVELYIEEADTGFKALEYLDLRFLPNLERLSKEDGQNIFPRLSHMDIYYCPKLLALPSLPSLGKLKIYGECSQALLGSIHNLHNLESLDLHNDRELASFPDGMLRNLTSLKEFDISAYEQLKVFQIGPTSINALEKLRISGCNSLELITEQTWQGLHSLKTLEIASCRKLKLSDCFQYLTCLQCLSLCACPHVEGSLSEILQHLTALQSLDLWTFRNLASLPDCFGSLSNLRSLGIHECPKLMRLPISIQDLCNLERLYISGCRELKKRCEKETGEDWHKIAHVRNIWVL